MASALAVPFTVALAVLACSSRALKTNQYLEYYIEDHCQSKRANLYLLETGISSAAVLHGTKFGFTFGGTHCTIIIRPPPYHGVILTVPSMFFGNSSLRTRCSDDYIQIIGERKLCGHRNEWEDNQYFVSQGDMKLTYHTENYKKIRLARLSLVATVYRNEYTYIPCTEDEFRCTGNKACIWKKFACDGVNNCGDFSDEAYGGNAKCKNDTPLTTMKEWIQPTRSPTMQEHREDIGVILTVCLLFLLLSAVLRCMCSETEDSAAQQPQVVCSMQDKSPPPPYSSYLQDDDDLLLDLGSGLEKKRILEILTPHK